MYPEYIVHLYRIDSRGNKCCICSQHFDRVPTLAEIQGKRPACTEIAVYRFDHSQKTTAKGGA